MQIIDMLGCILSARVGRLAAYLGTYSEEAEIGEAGYYCVYAIGVMPETRLSITMRNVHM